MSLSALNRVIPALDALPAGIVTGIGSLELWNDPNARAASRGQFWAVSVQMQEM